MPALLAAPWLGTAIAGVAGATGAIVGGEIASGGQKSAADTQSQTAERVAQIEKEASDKALAFQQQQAQQSQSNFIAAQNANYNQWLYRQGIIRPYQAMGTGALDMLGGMLGVKPANLPATPPPPTFQTYGMPGQPSSPAANYQPLLESLNSGQSPQAVIDAFNKSQGLPEGNSYAWRSIPTAPGGGVVEVPGGAYLAPGPDGKWGYTPAPNESGSTHYAAMAPPPTLSTYMNPYARPNMAVPFQPLG